MIDGTRLRAFRATDIDLVLSVAADPLIPLITTVPATGRREDALAYLARQHERLSSGTGFSFAIAEPWNEGSWKAAQRVGYQREGLLRSWQAVGEERRDMYMYSLLKADPFA